MRVASDGSSPLFFNCFQDNDIFKEGRDHVFVTPLPIFRSPPVSIMASRVISTHNTHIHTSAHTEDIFLRRLGDLVSAWCDDIVGRRRGPSSLEREIKS